MMVVMLFVQLDKMYQMNVVATNHAFFFIFLEPYNPPANTYYNTRKLFIVNTSTADVDSLQYLERCGISVLVQ